MGEHTPMYSCQNIICATETSYPSDMLALFMEAPICEECYSEKHTSDDSPPWSELPAFIPEIEAENTALREQRNELRDLVNKAYPIIGNFPARSENDREFLGAWCKKARAAIAKATP